MRTITPILLLAVSIGLFYLHIDPRYQQVMLLMDQKNQYEEALQKAEELQIVRDELRTKYNSFPREERDKLERLIPTKLNNVKLVTDLSAIAGPYGIAISGISVKDEISDSAQDIALGIKSKPYQTTAISFKFSGTYENMVNFLKDIEKSLQLVDVKSVIFNSSETSNLYEYTVTIHTYWLQ